MEIIKHKNKLIAEIHFLTNKKEIKNKNVIKVIKDSLLKCYEELPIINKKVVDVGTVVPLSTGTPNWRLSGCANVLLPADTKVNFRPAASL